MPRPAYFLLAVSTKENLELCKKYGLAGFTSSIKGAWTYCDIPLGSRISFLYGAKAHNLYTVRRKFCISGSDTEFPWGSLKLRSGRSYSFPFRLQLELVRQFEYPLTSDKFSYVGENLLLRGGYKKTHFQADSTDLGHASEIGEYRKRVHEIIEYSSSPFELRFTSVKETVDPPHVFPLKEIILQSAIRNYLSHKDRLGEFLDLVDTASMESSKLEVLGEKALPQGYVDILLKEANPTGVSKKLLIEVKLKRALAKDVQQLRSYMNEFGTECSGGVLIAGDFKFSSKLPLPKDIKCVECTFEWIRNVMSFEELVSSLKLKRVS